MNADLFNFNDDLLLLLSQKRLPSGLGFLHNLLSSLEDGGDLGRPCEHGLVEGEVEGREGVHVQQVGQTLQ